MKLMSIQSGALREKQYDILRIFAMISVVFIHAVTSETSGFQQLISTIAGTAVPNFFFLSGAFLLCRYNILDDLKKYYNKRFFKIFVPLAFFEIIYLGYTLVVHGLLKGVALHTEFSELINRWINFGIPGVGYHLWFMNVIIPFYVIAPLLIILRKKNIKAYCMLAILWLFFSECNFYFELISFPWFLKFIDFISFMMLGDVLKNCVLPTANINRNVFLVSFVVCIAIEMILKMSLINGMQIDIAEFILHDGPRSYIVVDPYTQQIINLIAAVAVFSFFYSVNVEKNYTRLADFCFYIYLAHYALEEVCYTVISKGISMMGLNLTMDVWFMSFIRTIFVLGFASICVLVLYKICKWGFNIELF